MPELTTRQRTLMAFAEKLTSTPKAFSTADTDRIRAVLATEEEVVEAANVVAGFNFANRVADALAVPEELPAILRRTRMTTRWGFNLWAWAVRMRMNFVDRRPDGPPPDEVLAQLEAVTRGARLGKVPAHFEQLRVRPHILAAQAEICVNLFTTVRLPQPTIVQIAYLASTVNGDRDATAEYERVAAETDVPLEPALRIVEGEDPGRDVSPLEAEMLAFANDVTQHADATTDEQVESLKRRGLDDVQVLELVLLTAAFNAGNRLNRALVPKAA